MTTVDIPSKVLAENLNQAVAVVNPTWQEEIGQEVELEGMLPKRYTPNEYVEDSRKVENILQTYNGDFAPKGVIEIGSVSNKLQIGQIDMLIKAKDIKKFFETRFPKYVQAGKDPMSTDFVGAFFGEFITKQIYRELNEITMNGIYAPRAEGVAGAFLNTFTGFDKRITDLVADGKIHEIAVGAITKSNIVAAVQLAMEEVPEKLRFKKGTVKMSKTWAKWYSENYKGTHPYAMAVTDAPTSMFMWVDDYDVTVVGLNSMAGKNYFVIDMEIDGEANMITVMHDEIPEFPLLRFESDKRDVAVMGEMYRCYGLRRYEYTYRSKVA